MCRIIPQAGSLATGNKFKASPGFVLKLHLRGPLSTWIGGWKDASDCEEVKLVYR
jgi:hypothetical protein